jgi:hypothetical protein
MTMTDVQKPQNNLAASRTVNDWTKSATRTLANGMNISQRRAVAHTALAAATAAAKPATPQPTAEEAHQALLERKRASNGVQSFNRLSFTRG